MTALNFVEAGPALADEVLGVIRRAYASRPRLDPPSTAESETIDTVSEALAAAGGLLALRRGVPAGALIFERTRPGWLGVRRVSVDPGHQKRGVASAMVGVAEDWAEDRGLDNIWVHIREEISRNVEFWQRRGFLEIGRNGPMVEFGKALWVARELPTADDVRTFGARLSQLLAPGDLVVLSGELGAGKTTMTQGIGEGMGVRGGVTSPTFVIARVHPSLDNGPALVHADAYRLGGLAELDDLDLDASLEDSVTVVEWGEGVAESLADSWLEVRIDRLLGDGSSEGEAALASAGPNRHAPRIPTTALDPRVVSVRPHGPRWVGQPLRSTLLL